MKGFGRAILVALAFISLGVWSGCGGGSSGVTVRGAPSISVSVSPTSASVVVNNTQQFMATVQFDSANKGVTWAHADRTGNCSPGCGTLSATSSASGTPITYTAPSTVPPHLTVYLTATSVTDSTKGAFSTVAIYPFIFASQNYPAGNTPDAVAVADFNGDGKLDIAVADYGNPSTGDNGGVSILFGNGDGTFQAATLINAGKNPISIAAGDFNGDGKKDLVVADLGDLLTGGNGTVSVLLGNGDGPVQPPITFGARNRPLALSNNVFLSAIAVGDFNGDLKLDIAITDFGDPSVKDDGGVYLLFGNGDGTFQAPIFVAAGKNPVAIVASDFNTDGKLDLAVADLHGPSTVFNGGVSVLLGRGDGTFQPATFFGVGHFPTSMTSGDVNVDGKGDLVVASFATVFGDSFGLLSVALGNGDGTLQPPLGPLSGKFFPVSPEVSDFDGDGKEDLVAIFDGVSVLLNRGDNTFQGPFNFGAGQGPFAIAVGDFNRDSKPDIVVANYYSNDITVLLNKHGL
jgi:hypothetical protein